MRIALKDGAGLCNGLLVLSPLAYQLTTLMDGTRTPQEICQTFQALSGQHLELELMEQLLAQLDESLALDNARSRQILRALPERPAAHQGGAYPAQGPELERFLASILDSGPCIEFPKKTLEGVIVPHIDLQRGSSSYGVAFRELSEHVEQYDTFVILGISHAMSTQPFILTRMNFATPLGTVETDQEFVTRLAEKLDFDPFEDEFNHLAEHSVEFQAVFLRYLLRRPFKIVPVLCGSFHRCLMGDEAISPRRLNGVASFLARLTEILKESPRTLVIASVDLAHQGVRFGGEGLTIPALRELENADRATLEKAVKGQSEAFIASLQSDRGARNYCGTSAIYTMLEVLGNPRGALHHYQQCNEAGNTSTVTIAAAGFYS